MIIQKDAALWFPARQARLTSTPSRHTRCLWLASHVVGCPRYDSYSLARLYSRCEGHAAPCTATTKWLPCFECDPVLPCNLCTARYHVTKSERMQQALPYLTNPARHIASLHVHVANAMPVAEGIVQQPACHTKAGGCTSRAVLSDQVQTRPPLPYLGTTTG